jgi:hypothetical protein
MSDDRWFDCLDALDKAKKDSEVDKLLKGIIATADDSDNPDDAWEVIFDIPHIDEADSKDSILDGSCARVKKICNSNSKPIKSKQDNIIFVFPSKEKAIEILNGIPKKIANKLKRAQKQDEKLQKQEDKEERAKNRIRKSTEVEKSVFDAEVKKYEGKYVWGNEIDGDTALYLAVHKLAPNEEIKEKAALKAVRQESSAYYYINNPSEAVMLLALKHSLYDETYQIFKRIDNPTEAVQLAAVKLQEGELIEYIKNPTEAVQLAAVKNSAFAIEYIKNPTEAVQLAAVKGDAYVIEYINNPSEAVQLAAVKKDGQAIEYINNPSEAVQLAAVKQDGWALKYIKNPSEAVQLAAVKQDGWALKYIKNPSEAVKKAAKRD